MDTWSNTIQQPADIRNLIQSVLLNFKTVSRQIRKDKANGYNLSNISLMALICMRNNKPMLRNDIMKQLKINYYDAGKALDPLIINGLIIKNECRERSNIKSIGINRIRYRMSLSGEMFIDRFLNMLQSGN